MVWKIPSVERIRKKLFKLYAGTELNDDRMVHVAKEPAMQHFANVHDEISGHWVTCEVWVPDDHVNEQGQITEPDRWGREVLVTED